MDKENRSETMTKICFALLHAKNDYEVSAELYKDDESSSWGKHYEQLANEVGEAYHLMKAYISELIQNGEISLKQ